jgi:hypothetical protein
MKKLEPVLLSLSLPKLWLPGDSAHCPPHILISFVQYRKEQVHNLMTSGTGETPAGGGKSEEKNKYHLIRQNVSHSFVRVWLEPSPFSKAQKHRLTHAEK